MRPPIATRPPRRRPDLRALLALLAALLVPSAASALEWWDGRLAVHGYTEMQLRWLSDGWDANNWYMSQWANVLNLELEADIAPNGFGPFDLVSGFARIEVRYECIFTGCGIGGSHQHFGDRADRAPARNWRDGYSTGLAGDTVFEPQERIHQGHSDLLTIRSSPLLDPIVALGGLWGVQDGEAFETLPRWLRRCVDSCGRPRKLATVGQALIHPLDWTTLARTALQARASGKALADALPPLLAASSRSNARQRV